MCCRPCHHCSENSAGFNEGIPLGPSAACSSPPGLLYTWRIAPIAPESQRQPHDSPECQLLASTAFYVIESLLFMQLSFV